ncbi:MAG: hypothetical protein ACLFUS_03225 [Candidatus Sumerlaeia bacterium]
MYPIPHWDRDWYWPVERFRVRLFELFQVMIEEFEKHPDYRFTMDGQTIIIEDYLKAHPEDSYPWHSTPIGVEW